MPTPIGISGTDGYTPIYQPDGRWTMWSYDEIYLGLAGQNKFIPKVNDWVVEPTTGTIYVVASIDPVTFIANLVLRDIQNGDINQDIMSSTQDNYRVYIDKSVHPYTLAPDGFIRVYSPTANYARIYKGKFVDSTNVISRRYDNNNNLIGTDIPLQDVLYNNHDNYGVKYIPSCNTLTELNDGDDCIIVVFDSNNKVVTKINCIAENTTYIPTAMHNEKYITQISLKSGFVDVVQETEIHFPVNLPIASFTPIGVVHYNDGSKIEYPIDGTKFRLFGLDQFVSTIIGHNVDLVLSYKLGPNEVGLASTDVNGGYITRPYNLIVSQPNRSYNVKLFVYPIWDASMSGYRLKVYLTNLDRNIMYDVTSVAYLAVSSPLFSPNAYGVTQRLTYNIDLADVSGMYSNFIHTQVVDIALKTTPGNTGAPTLWEVGSQVPSSVPYYGTNLRTLRDGTNYKKVTLTPSIATVQEFINEVYRKTIPQYNIMSETEAPDPTHIQVRWNGESQIVAIDDYGVPLTFGTNVDLYSNIEVVFLKQTPSGHLKLSIACLPVR